ncbi:MAG: hypothetical protein ACPGR7_02980 [Flavobacteriaceae bacterium]
MKKAFRILGLVFGFALTINNANATTIVEGFNKISIKNEGSVTVKLFDTEGEVVYTEAHDGNLVVKSYDFSQLPDGDYYMSIDTDVKKISKWFSIQDDKVVAATETVYYRPSIRVKSTEVYISKFALDQNKMDITVMDENGTELFTTTVSAMDQGKGLCFEKLPKGSYRVVASNNAYSTSASIDVK